MSDIKNKLIAEACKIIGDNFGENMAKNYTSFYQQRKTEEIIDSLYELLIEFVGEKNAEKQIKNIKQKYNL
ncbi:MAG: hypothetical protein WC752_00480 [Patescibacteria group bacterium]|jgi:hypothetical protein